MQVSSKEHAAEPILYSDAYSFFSLVDDLPTHRVGESAFECLKEN